MRELHGAISEFDADCLRCGAAEFGGSGRTAGPNKEDDWNGYGGVGDYANSNGNTQAVVNAGHEIRDKVYKGLPADTVETGEVYDCVIVGGGISGLAAALASATADGGEDEVAGAGESCDFRWRGKAQRV